VRERKREREREVNREGEREGERKEGEIEREDAITHRQVLFCTTYFIVVFFFSV